MCILKGFPTTLAASTTSPINYPFGMWFANDHTLYVADEGDGDTTYDPTTNTYINSIAAAQPNAGLEKWVFNTTTRSGTSRTRCRTVSTSASRTRCPVTRPA